MNAWRTLLTAACLVSVSAHAVPPPIIVPSDIAVTLAAAPTTNLVPGQRIDLTLTATNLGPATVQDLIVQSSPIYGDLSIDKVDCQDMAAEVVDAEPHPYYLLNWFLAGAISADFPAGETRTCHIGFSITAQASAVTPFSFGLPYYYVDMNPSNDTATVFLQRRVDSVPALSPMMLGLLALVLAVAGAVTWRLKVDGRARV